MTLDQVLCGYFGLQWNKLIHVCVCTSGGGGGGRGVRSGGRQKQQSEMRFVRLLFWSDTDSHSHSWVYTSSHTHSSSPSICGLRVEMNTFRGLWVTNLKWQRMASRGSLQEAHTSTQTSVAFTHISLNTHRGTLFFTPTVSQQLIERVDKYKHTIIVCDVVFPLDLEVSVTVRKQSKLHPTADYYVWIEDGQWIKTQAAVNV